MLRITEKDGGVTLDIAVKPRSSREGVGPVQGDRLTVAVNAPPVEGKANEAVVRVLAEAFGVSRSAVRIVRGETGRRKTVRLAGVGAEIVAQVATACR
ncbi:MAG: YggU family protein [Deltaproteobacteria bacterium]|nr:YggU family protein [Deltaproteobacteria bacterium]